MSIKVTEKNYDHQNKILSKYWVYIKSKRQPAVNKHFAVCLLTFVTFWTSNLFPGSSFCRHVYKFTRVAAILLGISPWPAVRSWRSRCQEVKAVLTSQKTVVAKSV